MDYGKYRKREQPMQTIYEHRQFGLVMLVILIVPTLGLAAAVVLSNQPAALLPLSVILVFMLFIIVTFGSLTVKVDTQQVLLYFGLGLLRRSFPLEQVTGARVVRNTLLMGLGIHFIRGGLIYNVSGLDGVEIILKDGRLARIGTDEPAALTRAIEQAKLLCG